MKGSAVDTLLFKPNNLASGSRSIKRGTSERDRIDEIFEISKAYASVVSKSHCA
jgi:hypothetical protein